MKRTARVLVLCAAVAGTLSLASTPASAGCSNNPPPPPPAAEVIKYELGDLVAVCTGTYDNCDAAIAICL